MNVSLPRVNMLENPSETWRPPLFTRAKGRRGAEPRRVLEHDSGSVALAPDGLGLVPRARRILDLQAGSIWNDLARLLPQCQGVLLDVGCGAQPYRPLVNPRATYVGIDYAEAERHFGYSMPDTIYYEDDRWPIDDASVDVVLCTETLEHVPDSLAFLKEAWRCLRPGGRLILTVPFAARWHFIPHDYWRFTPSGLDRLFKSAGFTENAVYARGNSLTVACYKVMALFLPLLFSQPRSPFRKLLDRACGLLAAPAVVALAGVANLSLASRGGNDCLGYTAIAGKPER